MTKKDLSEIQKMMILTFNDGFEQVVVPKLEEMKEEIGGKIKESEERVKKELREEFKAGQQSLSDRFEEVEVDVREINRKMDRIMDNDSEQNKRLDKVERIVKAN